MILLVSCCLLHGGRAGRRCVGVFVEFLAARRVSYYWYVCMGHVDVRDSNPLWYRLRSGD